MKHGLADNLVREQASLYALGAMDDDEARAFETHLADGCAVCREELRTFNAVVSVLAFDASERRPPIGARVRLLARLGEESRAEQTAPPGFVTVLQTDGEWTEISDGVFLKALFTDPASGQVTSMLKMLPGARVPDHRHTGNELCFILEGEFQIGGQTLTRGDFTCALKGSEHRDVTTETGALLWIVGPPYHEVLGLA